MKNKNRLSGIIYIPILIAAFVLVTVASSVLVLGSPAQPPRPFQYLCNLRPDAPACKIKEWCPELITKGLRECPRPTIIPRPSASPTPTVTPQPTLIPTPTPSPKPDLKVVGLSTEVNSCLPPECDVNTRLLNLTARFRNDGPGTAFPPITLRFWEDLNVNPTCNTISRISDVAVSNGLETGKEALFTKTIDISNSQPGQHFAAVMVDAQCKIAETNENNNSQITPYSF